MRSDPPGGGTREASIVEGGKGSREMRRQVSGVRFQAES
jgi:hypothetical protein